MLGRCWADAGPMLGQCWYNNCPTSRVIGNASTGPALGQRRVSIGPALGQRWASMLRQCKASVCPIPSRLHACSKWPRHNWPDIGPMSGRRRQSCRCETVRRPDVCMLIGASLIDLSRLSDRTCLMSLLYLAVFRDSVIQQRSFRQAKIILRVSGVPDLQLNNFRRSCR